MIRKYSKRVFIHILIVLQSIFLWHADTAVCKTSLPREKALQPVRLEYPIFQDDMDYASLSLAVERNLKFLKRLNPDTFFDYGPHRITCREVLNTQTLFLKIVSNRLSPQQLNRKILENFRIYRAAGQPDDNKMLFTGYYEPTFDAKLEPNHIFKYPIYRKPKDLIKIDLSLFSDKYRDTNIVARIRENKVLPYYTRYQIETRKVLDGKNLEIAWLKDPMDVYLLHIEGAGRLKLPNGKSILVNYDASNGRPYRSFGKYLLDNRYLSKAELSVEKIRKYLTSHPEIRKTVLNHNESYTFFRQVKEGPLGNIDVPLTKGRSLALDSGLFPKGALAFMSSKKPFLNHKGTVSGWTDFSRFVLNQDTGSAIKGPGRADLFWGSGHAAETVAWHFKQDGDLYLLIKKP